MSPLSLFNTLKQENESFISLDPEETRLYSCGPTVYNYVHIGNLRAYIFADLIKRALKFNGHKLNWVMNITDVDDKTIRDTIKKFGSKASVQNLAQETGVYFQAFLKDLDKININKNDIKFVNVSDVIPQIQDYILKLIEKGYAYKADDGSVYFSIEKYQADFGDYGQLVGKKFLEGKKVGARVQVDEYDKENLSDFALWKAKDSEDAEIFWDHSTLGPGRPGWHIECTVINHLNFPAGTDIHTGGIDLKFPHHTNEIAQGQALYSPFVKYWLHSEHIQVNDEKMAKSAGNFFTLKDLEEKGIANGLSLRFLYLQSHYRSKLNVSEESLAAATAGLKNLQNKIVSLKALAPNYGNATADDSAINEFTKAINNDFNTAEALAILQEVLDSSLDAGVRLKTAFKMDEVFGLDLEKAVGTATLSLEDVSPEIQTLFTQREQARAAKDYQLADKIRQELNDAGFEVIDTADGAKLQK
jgi:cysteinyl-tRNA synthetase